MISTPTRGRRLATVQDAADYWGVGLRTMRRRVAEGVVNAYRLPGSRALRIDLDELDAMLESGSTSARQ